MHFLTHFGKAYQCHRTGIASPSPGQVAPGRASVAWIVVATLGGTQPRTVSLRPTHSARSCAPARRSAGEGGMVSAVGVVPRMPPHAASLAAASIPATVSPIAEGFGATTMPQALSKATFSWALSPKAEMIAPAWPIWRPFGAARPAI